MARRAAKYDEDDDEKRKGWIGRFVTGVVVAVVVSAIAVVALSVFVLPPPEPRPQAESEETGEPTMISGIEVSNAPAYSVPTDIGDDGAASATAERGAAGADAADAGSDGQTAQAGPVELSGPALVVNSTPFEVDPSTPLVAVVLDDTNAAPLMHEALFGLGIPVTIGVVAGGGGDQVTANGARAAGLEVVAQLPLAQPGAADGGALEYGLDETEAARRTDALMQRLSVAVAATWPLASAAPPNATLLRGILAALEPLGFAYVDHGLAPGEDSLASSVGPDAIVGVSRFTIPAGANAAEAHSVLDRASAVAGREGTAVVFAAPSEELILALQLWGGAGSANTVAPAPLSAVILRQQGSALDELLGTQPVPEDAGTPAAGSAEGEGAKDQAPPASQ
jgi:polysaccharide deacetylase 2 family uncharacterized protein YibQ